MMIKRLLAYTLPAALLLPMPAMQAAENTNIFSAIVFGRSVQLYLNPNLTQETSYDVRIGGQIGISSIGWYAPYSGGLQGNFRPAPVNRLMRDWRGRATSCKGFPSSPLCARGARSYTPLMITFGGASQIADLRVALGGVQAERVPIKTEPAAIVARRDTEGTVSFGSFAQTGNAAIASSPQDRELFSGTESMNRKLVSETEGTDAGSVPPVMVPVLALGAIYVWAESADGKRSMRSCLINQAGLPDASSCTNTPVDATYRSGAVTPNAAATVWVNDSGGVEYRLINSDATLERESREIVVIIASGGARESAESVSSEETFDFVSFEANPSASRYAAASLGTLATDYDSDRELVMILTASTVGRMYRCSAPEMSASGEVNTHCDSFNLQYSEPLDGMVQPMFLRADLFVTAVDNKLLACQEQTTRSLDYSCETVATTDAAITTLSAPINAVQPRYSFASEGQSLSIEFDILMGLAEESTVYGTTLMVAGLQFAAADETFERASLKPVPGFTQAVTGLRIF
ncbi:MAG: hypothetical protein P1U32_03300 [Legionellaceae bacterium]|nr:hypothetical protein [Legionellaceae bacterium]